MPGTNGLDNERRRMTTCQFAPDLAPEGQDISYNEALFTLEREETKLTRKFDSSPPERPITAYHGANLIVICLQAMKLLAKILTGGVL